MIGWRDHPELLDDPRFMDLLTAGDSIGLNPNTAPAAVLATLPNVSPQLAAAIVRGRDDQPYPSTGLFAAAIGIDTIYAMTRINAFPSTSIRGIPPRDAAAITGPPR